MLRLFSTQLFYPNFSITCDKLECLYIPYTCPEESFDAILGGSDTVGAICFWDKPYVPEELDPNESGCGISMMPIS